MPTPCENELTVVAWMSVSPCQRITVVGSFVDEVTEPVMTAPRVRATVNPVVGLLT